MRETYGSSVNLFSCDTALLARQQAGRQRRPGVSGGAFPVAAAVGAAGAVAAAAATATALVIRWRQRRWRQSAQRRPPALRVRYTACPHPAVLLDCVLALPPDRLSPCTQLPLSVELATYTRPT